MSNLQTHHYFKLDFQKVDQHTGSKWLIHGTKRHKDTYIPVFFIQFPSDVKEAIVNTSQWHLIEWGWAVHCIHEDVIKQWTAQYATLIFARCPWES